MSTASGRDGAADMANAAPQGSREAPRTDPVAHRRAPPFILIAQWGITLALCAFLVVPVGMSVMAGLTVNYFRGVSSGLTLRWLAQVWTLYQGSVFTSLIIAAATLVITLIIGVPAGYVLARSRTRISRLIEELLVLPIAVPGLASALALLVVYGGFRGFRNSIWFITVGHVVFTLPFMVRAVSAVCASMDLRTLEEGAASLGASFVQRCYTIVLPNVRPGIIAGALAVVTLSLGEFNLTWMLHTPDTKTLPVGLADAYASMRIEVGSAYTIIFLVMTLPLLVAMQFFGVDPGAPSGSKLVSKSNSKRTRPGLPMPGVAGTMPPDTLDPSPEQRR